ncbi:uncharacterized protein LOC143465235 isoform X1 [Clavelina lepadiformis]|uniref:RING-type domain-containing protein n=1 Tax=Clavelina lepadiformis TaxID=159417 RepID=A0ABP0EW02_CLALP
MSTADSFDEVSCPICLDTLRKPVRILSCGHNLCHVCLVEYSRTSTTSLSCPTCRKVIHVDSNSVESFPRNWTVESMIERLSISNKEQPTTSSTGSVRFGGGRNLSSQELIQLQSLVEQDMKEKRFDDAIHILRRIVRSVEGYHKINHVINLVRCLFETDQIEEAKEFCKDLQSTLNSENFASATKNICKNCDVDLRQLAEDFVEKDYKTSIRLLKCAFKVIATLHSGVEKLDKLQNTAFRMTKVAQEMSRQNNGNEFKSQFGFMDEITDDMLRVTDVDLKPKCKKIARCLFNKALCFKCTFFYSQSIEDNKQAILLMKAAFGDDAKFYRVVGQCYNNLGAAYEADKQLMEAETAYLQAKHVYEAVTDWNDDDNKQSSIGLTDNNLKRVSDQYHNS